MENISNGKPITWFTRPENPFDSFYYYEPDKLILVRIRLELNRDDEGKTSAMYWEDRYVGFYPMEDDAKIWIDGKGAQGKFTIDEQNQIVWNGTPLATQYTPGMGVCDFVWTGNKNEIVPNEIIHIGNSVVSGKPLLPKGVSADQLYYLAQQAIIAKKNIDLTESTAADTELAKKIEELAPANCCPANCCTIL